MEGPRILDGTHSNDDLSVQSTTDVGSSQRTNPSTDTRPTQPLLLLSSTRLSTFRATKWDLRRADLRHVGLVVISA